MADATTELVPPKVKSVCVIGAGGSGLTAAKSCLEGGLLVTVYEKTDYMGGLWQYHEENTLSAVASVARSTIINTSKESSAFSDFPPPADFPNYMRNDKMVDYLKRYAVHFGVDKCVKFNHEVVRVTMKPQTQEDDESDLQWEVTVKDLKTGEVRTETFDGVMVSTGHHTTPSFPPPFPGQDLFRGRIIHSHEYKRPTGFDGQRIVVVGVGNSGCDAAEELSDVAGQVYLVTRRGTWIINRVSESGYPLDVVFHTRLQNTIGNLLPVSWASSAFEKKLNRRYDHGMYDLKPDHGFLNAHVTINEKLPNAIISGTVKVVRGGIERFTPDGVVFEGDDGRETPVDTVILATGYRIEFPFLDQSVISPVVDNRLELYKNVFSPRVPHRDRHTLAFIGYIQPAGPIFPISEMQSRWYVELILGNVRLPSVDRMQADIKRYKAWLAGRYYDSPRHTIQVLVTNYMDDVGRRIGVTPRLKKYFLTDFKLWRKCIFATSVPYQYRLVGPHAWDGARTAIMTFEDRVRQGYKLR